MTGSLKRLNRKLIEHDLFEFTLFFIISIESDPFDFSLVVKAVRVVYVGYRSSKAFAAYQAYRAGKLTHIFGQARHKLDVLVKLFGSQEKTYDAVQDAIELVIKSKGLTGTFEQAIRVGGQTVTVRGFVQDGITKIGTFFIK